MKIFVGQMPVSFVTAVLLASSGMAHAQATAGWEMESFNAVEGDSVIDTVKHNDGAMVKTFTTIVKSYATDADFARGIAKSLMFCPGIASAVIRNTSNGRGVLLLASGPKMQCAVVAGHGNNKQVASFGFQSASNDVDMVKVAEFMTFNRIDRDSTSAKTARQNTPAAGDGKTAPSTAAPTSLKAALDAIPRANRPIGMAFRSEWNSVSMSMGYTPWLLFANNIALEADCPAWNPAVSLTVSKPRNCDITRYSKTGDKISFDDDDPIDTGGFFGFKSGDRLTVNMSRQGGGSVGGGFGATSVLSSGELKMTATGRIDVGSWTGTSTQGGGQFLAATSNGRGISGQYLLDGYLIAIMDANGGISIGSIAGKIEGRDKYVFLNGKQYWN
jgi:hypothetical protein